MVRQLRRIGIAVAGGLVVTVGVAMVALPGPAILVIPAGLAILATEFPWARHLLHWVRGGLDRGLRLVTRGPRTTAAVAARRGEERSKRAERSRRVVTVHGAASVLVRRRRRERPFRVMGLATPFVRPHPV